MGIKHILIPPRTPWHNGKVERSHRNDQRYFYDWETFRTTEELNQKLREHLNWSNNKTMRTLGRKSPMQLLKENWRCKLAADVSLFTPPTAPFKAHIAIIPFLFFFF